MKKWSITTILKEDEVALSNMTTSLQKTKKRSIFPRFFKK